MRVPFVDLDRADTWTWGDAYRGIRRVAARHVYLRGTEVPALETALARLTRTEHAVGVASGTAALTIALRAAGIEPGMAVWTPAFGCPATVAAIVAAGARPCFVDVDAHGHGLWGHIRGEAAVPVHLFGRLDPCVAGLRARGCCVVEDCCQALGTPGAGQEGHAAAWSCYPTKPLGAWGDAGFLTTRDTAIAVRARALREYGDAGGWSIAEWGWNARMDEIQAAVLLGRIGRVREWQQQRARAAALYRLRLPPMLLGEWAGAENQHLFPIRYGQRNTFRADLLAHGISTGIHYPVTLPGLPACGGDDAAYPSARDWARTECSLPIWNGIRDHEVEAVCAAVLEVLGDRPHRTDQA